MEYKDIINNAIDELNRAIARIKEFGIFEENTITPDEELITDMENSTERLYELMQTF